MSLYYNIPFSKNIGLASALQLPFRTGSKPPKKRVAPYTGLGTRAGNVTKKIFRRVLNRFPGVERAAALRLLLVLFASTKRIKPFPFGNFPLHGKFAPVGAARSACFSAACGGYACCCRNKHAASRHFPGRRGAAPYTCTRKACVQAFSGGRAAETFPFGNILPAFVKAGQNTG